MGISNLLMSVCRRSVGLAAIASQIWPVCVAGQGGRATQTADCSGVSSVPWQWLSDEALVQLRTDQFRILVCGSKPASRCPRGRGGNTFTVTPGAGQFGGEVESVGFQRGFAGRIRVGPEHAGRGRRRCRWRHSTMRPHLRSSMAGQDREGEPGGRDDVDRHCGLPGDWVEFSARAQRPDDRRVVDQHLDRTPPVADRLQRARRPGPGRSRRREPRARTCRACRLGRPFVRLRRLIGRGPPPWRRRPASPRVMARPRPRPPPVTRATRPSNTSFVVSITELATGFSRVLPPHGGSLDRLLIDTSCRLSQPSTTTRPSTSCALTTPRPSGAGSTRRAAGGCASSREQAANSYMRARNVPMEPAFWGRRRCTDDLFRNASSLSVMRLDISHGQGNLHV